MDAAHMSKTDNGKQGNPKRPKAKLGLPELDQTRSAVLDNFRSPESKQGYRHPLDEFIEWYCSEPRLSFNKTVATRYPDLPRKPTPRGRNDQRPQGELGHQFRYEAEARFRLK